MLMTMLSNEEVIKITEISDITGTDYELNGNFISPVMLLSIIDDLLDEYHKKENEVTELQEEIESNYEPKKINPYTEYGLNERDFI